MVTSSNQVISFDLTLSGRYTNCGAVPDSETKAGQQKALTHGQRVEKE
jgi:hypothetical protein